MNIGILGTGNLAEALGRAWVTSGHTLTITGRDPRRTEKLAEQIGASAISPADFASHVDVVVVAITFEGLEEALELVGSLAGKSVIDCTNTADFAGGRLKTATGSAAELVSRVAAGAHVVKALNIFAGNSWPFTGPKDQAPLVAVSGNDKNALDRTAELIEDLGGHATVVGDLTTARQLEEVAGFVMRLVTLGHNPRSAIPSVD